MPLSVELRPDPDGSFDEMVATGVGSVHAEMMDDGLLWIRIEPPDEGQAIVLWVSAAKRGKLVVTPEFDPCMDDKAA